MMPKYHISNNFFFTVLKKIMLWPQLLTMSWNMNMYTVCFQPTCSSLSYAIDGTVIRRNRKQCSKLRLVPITKLTIDDLFYDYYDREMMSHEEFSFLEEEGGEGGILLKMQFLLQVSYNIVKNIVKFFFVNWGKT